MHLLFRPCRFIFHTIAEMKLPSSKVLVCLLCCLFSVSVNKVSAAEPKDTIRIGVFIESLYDLNFSIYSYHTNFWMWSVVDGDVNKDGKVNDADSIASMERIKMIELSNAKEYQYSHQMAYRTVTNGQIYWWATQFCKADIYQQWAIDNYPFDDQNIELKFESSAFDTTQAIMLNSDDTITFKDDINLIGWKISKGKISSSIVKYGTDFGDPAGNGTSYYSRVVFAIGLKRISAAAYFIKLCLGVFIAFLVAMLGFAIGAPHLESRFGLGVGALFAVTANKYVVDSSIPESATNSLVDKIHEVTFVYILFILAASAVALILHSQKKDDARIFFDKVSGTVILVTYFLILLTLGLAASS